MFAVAIDGELRASKIQEAEVVKILRLADREGSKAEVATFQAGEGWVPVCVEKFLKAA